MPIWLVIALSVIVGIPASYALNRQFTARYLRRTKEQELARKTSLLISFALWCDVAILVALIVTLGHSWWVGMLFWLTLNYAMVIYYTLKVRKASKQVK
jgi:putative flippase GtrA